MGTARSFGPLGQNHLYLALADGGLCVGHVVRAGRGPEKASGKVVFDSDPHLAQRSILTVRLRPSTELISATKAALNFPHGSKLNAAFVTQGFAISAIKKS
jgi:hypothetical protein